MNKALLRLCTTGVVICIFLLFWNSISFPLFQTPYSHALYDYQDNLISATIAEDEQWRFFPADTLPELYIDALLEYEDQRFFQHIGVDLIALLRATYDNARSGKIVSGGSTITMQLMRLAGNNPPRTLKRKLYELIQALRVEITYSKDEILQLYAAHAPFGGNIVGLHAACVRYLNKSPMNITWSEAALMAILPNAPSLIYPGKNQQLLLTKRNNLLKKLHEKGHFNAEDLAIYLQDPLPTEWHPIPDMATHFMYFLQDTNPNTYHYYSTIRQHLQHQIEEIISHYAQNLVNIGVHNTAIIVIDNEKNEVMSYIGNTPHHMATLSPYVDCAQGLRSPGSLLKPLLYAQCIDDGIITPHSLIEDVPKAFGSYFPQNFNLRNEGILLAPVALKKSLNVPFVRLLQEYGVERFYDRLPKFGIHEMDKGAGHYGLSLILGSGETTLWSLTNTYAQLSQVLEHFLTNDGLYIKGNFTHAHCLRSQKEVEEKSHLPQVISATAAYYTLETLQDVVRPSLYGALEKYSDAHRISWKTGTSIGFKDAWAIGTSKKYTVGVWTGNADGGGRAGLTGAQAAAPLLFQIFRLLTPHESRVFPFDDASPKIICQQSGYLATTDCTPDTLLLPTHLNAIRQCPYHIKIHLTESTHERVYKDCYSGNIIDTSWMVFSPKVQYYMHAGRHQYSPPPSLHVDCKQFKEKRLGIVYPDNQAEISLPTINGIKEKVVLTSYHSDKEANIYWYLNQRYIGKTSGIQSMPIELEKGAYQLTIQDDSGQEARVRFKVIQ